MPAIDPMTAPAIALADILLPFTKDVDEDEPVGDVVVVVLLVGMGSVALGALAITVLALNAMNN